MSIYFIQSVDGGPVKIGVSSNVKTRRKQLEKQYGCELVILATMKGGREAEKMIHAEFNHLRLGRSEQFRPAIELMAFIGKPLLVGANPDTIEAMKPVANLTIAQIRGSEEWKAWVEEIADKECATVSKLFERAVRKFAKENGYRDPPKR